MLTTASPHDSDQSLAHSENSTRWEFSPNVGVGIGWCIHLFTGLGIICGVLSIDAIVAGNAKPALFWLIVAQVIDGIDGPVARACGVAVLVPRIDGYIFDLVIDFVTCVLAPVAFIHGFHMFPAGPTGFIAESIILLCAGLWFSRTDMYTDDHWFRGFPAPWNMVVTILFLMRVHPGPAAGICMALSLLSLSNVQFAHGTQISFWRKRTIGAFAIWLIAMTYGTVTWKAAPGYTVQFWVAAGLILGTGYYFLLSIKRHRDLRASSVTVG